MMGIYIKGMEMPTSCYDCPLQNDECFGSIKCQYAKTWGSARMRAVDCPLVPVPKHGRLIDADALEYHADNVRDPMGRTEKTVMWSKIQSAPTIIQASEEGE